MLRLALRNVFRQRTRSLITLAAIVFGVVGLILSGGFVHDMFGKLAEAIIHSQTGHVQVARTGFFAQGFGAPEKYVVRDPHALAESIARLPGVTQIASRIQFSGLLSNGRTSLPFAGEGLEPEKEARLSTHLLIKEGRTLADSDAFGALLGEGLARALKIRPGDRIWLLANSADGAMNTLDFEVVGTFQSLSKEYDARAVKIPLAAAQELLGTQGANVLVVSLQATRNTSSVASQLRALVSDAGLEVLAWHEVNDFYPKTVKLYDRQFGVLRLIILVMVLLSVANSVNMSVFERVGEFGTMRALGDTRGKVFRVVMAEAFALGLAGSAVGLGFGAGLAFAISSVGIPMPPPPNSNIGYVAEIRLVPLVVWSAFAVGLAATVLASIVPALRASRIGIAEALKHNV